MRLTMIKRRMPETDDAPRGANCKECGGG
jgi:hypothetical protein